MNWLEQALEKLDREEKNFKGNRYEGAMQSAVANVLRDFCRQKEEFAQAVVQGGSFAACMAAVAKDLSAPALSDEEAYQRAASFYFQGARVKMKPEIQLEPEEPGKVIDLDFTSFFS